MSNNKDDGCGCALIGLFLFFLLCLCTTVCNSIKKESGSLVETTVTDDEGNTVTKLVPSSDKELGKLKNQVDAKIKDLDSKYQSAKQQARYLNRSIQDQINSIKEEITASDYEYGYSSAIKRFKEGEPTDTLLPAYNKWKLLVPDVEALVRCNDWIAEIDREGTLTDLKVKSKKLMHAITINDLDIGSKREILELINTPIPGWDDTSSSAVTTNRTAVNWLEKQF
ncbi:MAG: hypothetical protein LBG58_07700 [Planctomycetaceae bacterium]|jgi:hypothetical protein|nr:hypothetical protein [Planctomycetaceae bacterium]